jgi:hypothetical protein
MEKQKKGQMMFAFGFVCYLQQTRVWYRANCLAYQARAFMYYLN